MIAHPVSIAPMIDYTDKHFRYFLRGITKHALLYTEMLTTAALLKGNKQYLLDFNAGEEPIACQLGGSSPVQLARCSSLVEQAGFNEVNLNLGCPSPRVQAGQFGACLMYQPELVTDCLKAMQDSVSIPVTAKCRIGVDEHDSYAFFEDFIGQLVDVGCKHIIVHARKAWLNGLSPKQNRTVPPLKYHFVSEIKKRFPLVLFTINGGINDLDQQQNFYSLDGIMIGRQAYQSPYHLSTVDSRFYDDHSPIMSRHDVYMRYMRYLTKQLASGHTMSVLVKPLLGLMHGQAGGKKYRQAISTFGSKITLTQLNLIGENISDG